MKKNISFIFCIFFCGGIYAQQNLDTVRIHSIKITDRIYMLKGGEAGNIGLLTGPEGILMIDDQFGALSQKIMDAIKNLDPGQVRFVINTHIHGDHAGGNVNFKKAGATIVAHSQVRRRFIENQKKSNSETMPAADKTPWPLITFNKTMSFHMNDEDIELLNFDPGHTDGDVIIHFKNANVFHTGDAFVRYGYPYIDPANGGTINGFISTLDQLLPLLDDNSRIIPGHGEIAKKSDVKLLRDILTDLRDQVAAALKAGKKKEEISGMPFATKYDKQMAHEFLKGKDFVVLIAESLSAQKKQ